MTPVRGSRGKRRGGAGGLRVVCRAAPRAKAPSPAAPAFPPRDGATPRQLALFEIVRARARVVAAIHGIAPAAAERCPAAGRWSVREAVLSLHAWDVECARALEPALSGVRPAWLDRGPREPPCLDEALLAPLRAVPWDEALRRLHAGHARLLEAIESLPEEPAELWTRDHPLGGILALVPENDRRHAEIIQEARTAATPPPRTP